MIQVEQIQCDLAEMRMRKDQAVQGFNQIVGAISALEQLLAKAQATDSMENTDGEANEQAEEQTA